MATTTLFPRFASEQVTAALADTPVVLINGPRQCGKTTLMQQMLGADRDWFSLDDEATLNAAIADPVGLIRGRARVAIDEVQRAPALLRAIKKSVDEDRQLGRFLLTGSTDVLTLPKLSDSLAGRMEVVELLPLAQAEIVGHRPGFLSSVLAGAAPPQTPDSTSGPPATELALRGGYPEMVRRSDAARRRAWAREYLRAVVQRDVRDIASIDRIERMPRLLRALAQHSGQLANFTQLAGQLGIDDKTARKYVGVFEQLFLVRRLEPWFRNHLKRLVKTPKVHFIDAGLLAAMRSQTAARRSHDRTAWGSLLETFVHGELLKAIRWHPTPCQMFHYRDKDRVEVDFVIETDDAEVVGIEVKAAASVSVADFSGLRRLAGAAGRDFRAGVLLHDGERVLSFGSNLYAAPFSSLWAR